jgi:hypothetical protein
MLTTQEFMDELDRASPQFVWTLEPDTGIHAPRRTWPRLLIRGVPRNGPDSSIALEPMGALWYARTGALFEPGDWARAGDALGILPVRAAELDAAASDRTWAGAEGRREPVEYLQVLRARLLDAVGLSVRTGPAPASRG